MDTAIEALWSNGYEACSTEALCKKRDLAQDSLYNAFGSEHDQAMLTSDDCPL
ncbi:TetR family transcriptional regulator [Paenibacillus paeoniae]|uniref:TetR family transcriptional regulator n=1 Tax=Paenibacillus paeoniae TaxID=2292705 RepID=UPI0023E83F69|nr:TetR family transcriptional regulator [Paenibacillus paeoniae]